MVPTSSPQKQLVEQVQFCTSRSTRHRPVRSVEQPVDDVEVVYAQDFHDLAAETNATHITYEMVADEVADEVVQSDVVVVDLVVHPDVVVIYLISFVIADIEVTTPSTEPYVHIDGGLLEGLVDRKLLIEYADHVAY